MNARSLFFGGGARVGSCLDRLGQEIGSPAGVGMPFREGRLSQTKIAIGSFKKLFNYLRASLFHTKFPGEFLFP